MKGLQEVIVPAKDWDAIRGTLSDPESLGSFGFEVRTSTLIPDGWIGTVDSEGNLTLYAPTQTEVSP